MLKLDEILLKYNKILETASTDINIIGKTIQEACMEHHSLYQYYYDKLSEIKKLSTLAQIEVDKLISLHYKNYNENYDRSIATSMMSKYIESEKDVIFAKQELAEIDEIKNKFEAVKDAFISRGYQLNNITKIRVAEIEDGIL